MTTNHMKTGVGLTPKRWCELNTPQTVDSAQHSCIPRSY